MTARVYSPATQCDGKQRYAAKADAKRAAKHIEHRIGSRLDVYHCVHCDGFHLGHKPRPYNWPGTETA